VFLRLKTIFASIPVEKKELIHFSVVANTLPGTPVIIIVVSMVE